MSIQSRIEETKLAIGDKVAAFKSPTASRRDPRQADLFNPTTVYEFGRVTGFLTFPNHVLVMVAVEGSEDSHPYPIGVWHLYASR